MKQVIINVNPPNAHFHFKKYPKINYTKCFKLDNSSESSVKDCFLTITATAQGSNPLRWRLWPLFDPKPLLGKDPYVHMHNPISQWQHTKLLRRGKQGFFPSLSASFQLLFVFMLFSDSRHCLKSWLTHTKPMLRPSLPFNTVLLKKIN